jgi:hypothetical protein
MAFVRHQSQQMPFLEWIADSPAQGGSHCSGDKVRFRRDSTAPSGSLAEFARWTGFSARNLGNPQSLETWGASMKNRILGNTHMELVTAWKTLIQYMEGVEGAVADFLPAREPRWRPSLHGEYCGMRWYSASAPGCALDDLRRTERTNLSDHRPQAPTASPWLAESRGSGETNERTPEHGLRESSARREVGVRHYGPRACSSGDPFRRDLSRATYVVSIPDVSVRHLSTHMLVLVCYARIRHSQRSQLSWNKSARGRKPPRPRPLSRPLRAGVDPIGGVGGAASIFLASPT